MKPGFRIEAVVMIMGKPQIKWLFVKSGFVARGTDTNRHLEVVARFRLIDILASSSESDRIRCCRQKQRF